MIALAAACGARTELELAQRSDDGGGGGSGGEGEGGAPPPSCVLAQLPGEIVLAGGEAFQQGAPNLERSFNVDTGEPAPFATLVHKVSTASVTRLTLESVPLESTWPPEVDFVPPLQAFPGCVSYVREQHYALFADAEQTPTLGSILVPEPYLPVAVGEATPAFLREDVWGTKFGAFTIAADSQLYLIDVNAQNQVDFRLDWGCGSTPVRADAIPWAESYLVALTSGADFGGCGIPGGAGPSTRLQIARFSGLEGELLYEVDLGRSVASLVLAPRADGAWLAVREDGAGADTTIDVYRLDENGVPVGEPTLIDPHGPATDIAFSAAEMGEWLVVSYRDEVTSRLTIQIVEADGRLGANAVLTSPDNGESSVLGKDDSVFLAYTTPDTQSQVRVARFECVAP